MDNYTSYWLDRERDKDEWRYAWGQFPDSAMYNAEYGESLQYMGTWLIGGKWVHQFRHRAIPGLNERRYWNVPASAGFQVCVNA